MSKKKSIIAKPVVVAVPAEVEAIEEIRQLAARDVFEAPQPVDETVAQLIGRIENLPPGSANRAVLSLALDGGDRALPLLEQLVQARKASRPEGTRLAAIEALAVVRSSRSAEILARIADSDTNRDLRKEAKRALFKLRSLGVAAVAPVAGPEEAKPRNPVLRSILSSFDGAGNRGILFGIERPLGGVDRIVLLVNALKGLTDCSGLHMSRTAFMEEAARLVKESMRGGIWADAPASYCQQLVHESLALNLRSGTGVPRGYYYWKDEIGQPTEHYDRPLVYREISALEVKWEPTLLEHSGELLDRPEFDSWAFDPHKVERYFFELQQSRRSAVALPGWSQKERDEAVLRRFFEEVLQPDEHAAYKRELEETAYLFLRRDRRIDARRALSVAVAMDELHGGELIKIPFFRELLTKSFALIERELRGEARRGSIHALSASSRPTSS